MSRESEYLASISRFSASLLFSEKMMTFNIDHAWVPKKCQTFFLSLKNQLGFQFLNCSTFYWEVDLYSSKEIGAEDIIIVPICHVSRPRFDLQYLVNQL